jgi:hypothetical protein
MKCKWHLCTNESVPNGKYCGIKCKNKWTQTQHVKRKKKMLVDYKGGKCEKCGYDKHQEVLTFHHIDPMEKEFQFSSNRARGKTKGELFAEADKCVLLCANCHAEEHIVHENKLVVNINGDVPGSYPD